MKNLNEIYKVEELNELELNEVNGGGGLLFFCIAAFYVGYMEVMNS